MFTLFTLNCMFTLFTLNCMFTLFTLNCMFTLFTLNCIFTLSEVPLKNYARATPAMSPTVTLYSVQTCTNNTLIFLG